MFLTAGGQRYTEEHAKRLAQYDNLTLVCGHYEGIDERVIEAFADEEISIGDYILTGGELASLVVADSVLRLKPGVLAEQKGYEEESYWDGLLEYPQYTRPEVWEDRAVPEVLLGGDHAKIDAWRGEQSRHPHPSAPPGAVRAVVHEPPHCRSAQVEARRERPPGEDRRAVCRRRTASLPEGRQRRLRRQLDRRNTARHPDRAAEYLLQLRQEKAAGWACYLHTTKDVPDGMVSVSHKAGHVEHLFVTESARGKGIGAEAAGLCPQKAAGARAPGAERAEHQHPRHRPLHPHGLAAGPAAPELEFDPQQYPAVAQ